MKIELLAPAGGMDSLVAAINAGCDAIYLGGSKFSARSSAVNFSNEEIETAVKLARLRGVKIYVTINILISDGELEEFFSYVSFLYRAGCHGVIVQDPALGFIIARRFKDMEVHASTQMSINNYFGAKFVRDLSYSRVVLAREATISEIKKVKDLEIDIEHFIHGALCVSYSGQCTMSSLIGGRSGNRGDCAQACRKPYEIYDKDKNLFSNSKYFISPRDLMSFDTIGDLIDAGVNSLKIEGRMKRKEYVYEVVQAYRKKLDGYLDKIDIEDVKQIFNRSFTQGIGFNDFGRNFISYDRPDNRGVRVGTFKNGKIILDTDLKRKDGLEFTLKDGSHRGFTLSKDLNKGDNSIKLPFKVKEGSEIRRTQSAILNKKIDEKIESIYKIPIEIEVFIGEGKYPLVTLKANGKLVHFEGRELVQSAKNKPITDENIRNSFSKLNDTDFYLKSESDLKIITEGNSFIPVSLLNELRRDSIRMLEKEFTSLKREEDKFDLSFDKRNMEKESLTLEVNDVRILDELDLTGVSIVYIPLKSIDEVSRLKSMEPKLYVKLPQILSSEELIKAKEKILKERPDGVLLNNLSQLEIFKDTDINVSLDSSFNIFNSISSEFFLKRSESISLSTELKMDQIKAIRKNVSGNLESIVYGFLNVMVMEHCPISIVLDCKDNLNCEKCRESGLHFLKDSKGEYFGFRRENKKTIIYNSHPLLYENRELTNFVNRRRIVQTVEDTDTIAKVLDAFRKNDFNELKDFLRKKYGSITKAHYNRGIL